jgi:hypothetical protein
LVVRHDLVQLVETGLHHVAIRECEFVLSFELIKDFEAGGHLETGAGVSFTQLVGRHLVDLVVVGSRHLI